MTAINFRKLEKRVKSVLDPYLSLGPNYSQMKARATQLFPDSNHPDSALHYGTCFAEQIVHLFDTSYFQKAWMRPVDEILHTQKASMENLFTHLLIAFKNQMNSQEGKWPFMGCDYLSPNLACYLNKVAQKMGIPVVACPSTDVFLSNPVERYTPEMLQILQGKAVGNRDTDSNGNYIYLAGFSNPKENSITLMTLLRTQLEFANAEGKLTDLGSRIYTLLSDESFVEFVSERFASGIQWSLANIASFDNSPAYFFVYYGWFGSYSYCSTVNYDDVGTMGVRIKDKSGWHNFFSHLR